MRALVLVGHAFFRDDRAIAVREAIDNGSAHATRSGTTRDDQRVAAMEGEQRGELRLVKGGGHSLVDDDVAPFVDHQAIVKLGTARANLDVLKRVGRVGPRSPNAAVLPGLHVGDVGPDDWQSLFTCKHGKLIDIVELLGIGRVRSRKLAYRRIGLLQIYVDQRRFAAEAEARPRGALLDIEVELACSLVGELHWRTRYCPAGIARLP